MKSNDQGAEKMFLLAIDTSGILVIEIIIAAIEIIGAALLVAILFFMILPLKKGNQKPSVAPKKAEKSAGSKEDKDEGGDSDESDEEDDESDDDDEDDSEDDEEDDEGDEDEEEGDDDEDDEDED